MRRALLGVLGLLALSAPAAAHFPWVIPSEDGKKARIVFSDTLAPDKDVPITKLSALKVYGWGVKDKEGVRMSWAANKDEGFLSANVLEGKPFLGGECRYGVV